MTQGSSRPAITATQDPVPGATRFVTMRGRKGFPDELVQSTAELESRMDKLTAGDVDGWAQLYRDLLDAAHLAVDSLRNVGRSSSAVRSAGTRGAARPPSQADLGSLRRVLSDVEKCDRDAISYVLTERVPKQRNTEIRDAMARLSERLFFSSRMDGDELVVELDAAEQSRLRASLESVFSEWKAKAIAGCVARMEKHREPILQMMDQQVRDAGIQFPGVTPPEIEPVPVSFKTGVSLRARIPSLPEAAWRFFRSTLGIVFLAGTILAGFVGGGRAGGSSAVRLEVYAVAIPLFLVIAIVQSVRSRRQELKKSGERLQTELTKLFEGKLREASDDARLDIQAALKKFQSEHEHQNTRWWCAVENRTRQMPSVREAPEPVESVASSSQARALVSQIEEKVIPSVSDRLCQIEG